MKLLGEAYDAVDSNQPLEPSKAMPVRPVPLNGPAWP